MLRCVSNILLSLGGRHLLYPGTCVSWRGISQLKGEIGSSGGSRAFFGYLWVITKRPRVHGDPPPFFPVRASLLFPRPYFGTNPARNIITRLFSCNLLWSCEKLWKHCSPNNSAICNIFYPMQIRQKFSSFNA